MTRAKSSKKSKEKAQPQKIDELANPSQDVLNLTYPDSFINKIVCGDCIKVMKAIPDNTIDLIVTSPPYDNLRTYNGFNFEFPKIAEQMYRILKKTGVAVWVVGDRITDGNKSLTSFRQAIQFQDIGFKIHDVMIYKKKNTPFMRSNAYTNCYEFMFVLTKNKPKVFHPLMEPTRRNGFEMLVHNKKADGINKKIMGKLNEEKVRTNIWEYAVGLGGTTNDKIAFQHPAVFPESLVADHITSWTDEGDIVLDPMCGSGTTPKVSKMLNRKYIGIDISEEYCAIAKERVGAVTVQTHLGVHDQS